MKTLLQLHATRLGLMVVVAGLAGCDDSSGTTSLFDASDSIPDSGTSSPDGGTSSPDGGTSSPDGGDQNVDAALGDSGVADAAQDMNCTQLQCGANSSCDDSSGAAECVCDPGYELDEMSQSCVEDRSSCASLLAADPSLLSGTYELVDESGTTTVECDMDTDGGGWRVLYDEDFEGLNTTADSWSEGEITITDCGFQYSRFLGGFFQFGVGASPSITIDVSGISHSEARVELDFVVIDDWDGERGFVRVDDSQIIQTPTYTNPGQMSDVCGGQMQGDLGPQPLSQSFDHTADALTLEVSSNLDEGADNESFGVDNVRVLVRQ